MKVLFIIQGEGRGHQTQALALAQILKDSGHEVILGLVGTCKPDVIPKLLNFNSSFPVRTFYSPGLVYKKTTLALSPFCTLKQMVYNLPKYIKSINLIKSIVEETKPKIIINFYDLIGGLYSYLNPKGPTFICIGHQYLLQNTLFQHPKENFWSKKILNFNSKITSLNAKKRLALSFSPFKNEKSIITVPPLLRKELNKYNIASNEHILVYFTQDELVFEFLKKIQFFPEQTFELFINKDVKNVPDNVIINKIDPELFVQKMASAKGVICTAGFESVCEAMFFSKPVMVVPIKNHYEQLCNAVDAKRAGAALYVGEINIGAFLEYIKYFSTTNHKNWLNSAPEYFLKELGLKPKAKINRPKVKQELVLELA